MLAGTRESDDPTLPLRVNTYVWPTCTSDPAPLVAANKMVKCVLFQTHTHKVTAVTKRELQIQNSQMQFYTPWHTKSLPQTLSYF